jgi:hypothetical protein
MTHVTFLQDYLSEKLARLSSQLTRENALLTTALL